MPRKSKSASNVKSQSNASAQPTLTDEPCSTDRASPNDRGAGGQFTKGNAGGPGNPHARACAKMLQAFRDNITEDEMLQICRMLFVKAVGGDISAAKIILSYKIGKPLPAPHPDSIDRDEWDHYQNDAIQDKEMKLVLSSLPTHSGNDIARVSLPIMTAARMNDLAAELLDGLPAKKDEGGRMKDEENTETTEPLANGKMEGAYAEKGEGRGEKSEKTISPEPPLANGKSRGASEGRTRHNKANNKPFRDGQAASKRGEGPPRRAARRKLAGSSGPRLQMDSCSGAAQ